jgi:hypothetical protein
LVSFLDGELSSPESEDVRTHLESCEACRKEAELLRSTLAVAVDRCREKNPPAAPENFASLFWEEERARREKGQRAPVRHVFSSLRWAGAARYAVAAFLPAAIAGVVIFAVLRSQRSRSQGDVARSETRTGRAAAIPPPLEGERLADIERRLAELEASVRRIRIIASTGANFRGDEMREIYAAIGLAAAKNYGNVLEMPDEAARRYGEVASMFPETAAGREAEDILSGLN